MLLALKSISELSTPNKSNTCESWKNITFNSWLKFKTRIHTVRLEPSIRQAEKLNTMVDDRNSCIEAFTPISTPFSHAPDKYYWRTIVVGRLYELFLPSERVRSVRSPVLQHYYDCLSLGRCTCGCVRPVVVVVFGRLGRLGATACTALTPSRDVLARVFRRELGVSRSHIRGADSPQHSCTDDSRRDTQDENSQTSRFHPDYATIIWVREKRRERRKKNNFFARQGGDQYLYYDTI